VCACARAHVCVCVCVCAVEERRKREGQTLRRNGVGESTITRIAGARKCFEYNAADNEDVFDACALFSLFLSLFFSLAVLLILFNCKSYVLFQNEFARLTMFRKTVVLVPAKMSTWKGWRIVKRDTDYRGIRERLSRWKISLVTFY